MTYKSCDTACPTSWSKALESGSSQQCNEQATYSETSLYGHLVKRSPTILAVSRDGPKIFANTLHSY